MFLILSPFFQSWVEKVESLERDLETAKATFGQNAEALAKSLEE